MVRVDREGAWRRPFEKLLLPLSEGDDRDDDEVAAADEAQPVHHLERLRVRCAVRVLVREHEGDGLERLAHAHLVGQDAALDRPSLLRTKP